MAWNGFNSNLATFPSPWRTGDVYYPHLYRGYKPYYSHNARDLGTIDDDWKGEKGIAALLDKTIECSGDLGWSLNYATAWCYQHLISNQPEVVDAIDTVRECCDAKQSAPFYIFEHLDTALFGSKLRGMVCLRWKSQTSCSPGTTSAPGVLGVPRILIQLNSTPFEDDDADIDDLLDALIHHMIHAYFLVCCGAQKKVEKQDGRLMDGTHFGVILMTIRDITKQCKESVLPFIFHATKRKDVENGGYIRSLLTCKPPIHPGSSSALPFISIDPHGSGVGPALADGQTHCLHDNRSISYSAIKNWQVNEYSRALDTNMESKGAEIYEFEPDSKLTPILRLKGPPSVTYAELIWEGKRVMVPREKALRFKSIEGPLKKHGRYELEVPKCDGVIFACIYDFINKGEYAGSEGIVWDSYTMTQRLQRYPRAGPPVIVTAHQVDATHTGAVKHIKIFKVAEKLKFEELMHHSLGRLWEMPLTSDDPLEILGWLYDVTHATQSGPIHAELHKWARAFLSKTEDRAHLQHPATSLLAGHRPGTSNVQKIQRARPQEFRELLRRSEAFQDDYKLARAELLTRQPPPGLLPSASLDGGVLGHDSLPSLGLGRPLTLPAILSGLRSVGAGNGLLALDAAPALGTGVPAWQEYVEGGHDDVEEILRIPLRGSMRNRYDLI